MINSNDLKKGTPITLKCGWAAVIMDNKKGATRLAEVDGYFKEIGSIYANDIDTAFVDGKWQPVTRTMSKNEAMMQALKDMDKLEVVVIKQFCYTTHMGQFRYVAFIDGEKMRAFHSRDELNYWLRDKPEATFVKYSVKRKPKEKLDLSQFPEAPF